MSKASPSLPYGTLDLLVLRTLAAGPRHGYGILLQIHEASNNLLRIEEGSLYPALHRLETSGLLKSEWMTSRQIVHLINAIGPRLSKDCSPIKRAAFFMMDGFPTCVRSSITTTVT